MTSRLDTEWCAEIAMQPVLSKRLDLCFLSSAPRGMGERDLYGWVRNGMPDVWYCI